jgi:hypothetical protein
MWRRFPLCKLALIFAGVLWIAAVDAAARGESKGWIVLKDCRLIANPANDGDSFHVSVGDKEYLFRLYFVDAPETDAMNPGRLVEQAKYFTITVPQTIEVGQAAKEFTRAKNCPSHSQPLRICQMRWARADSRGFTPLFRQRKEIWASSWCATA